MPRYASMAQIRLALRVPTDDGASSWMDDTWTDALRLAAESSEDMIDEHCDRRFDETTEARTFVVDHPVYLDVGDWTAITSVVADGDTLDTEDWRAAVGPVRFRPANGLVRRGGVWPNGKDVVVTGSWGWADVPNPVCQATVMMAARLFKRLDSPLGVMSLSGEGLYVPKIDQDVMKLLEPFCRKTLESAPNWRPGGYTNFGFTFSGGAYR